MMDFFLAVIVVLGGAATFVYGLKLLGEGTEKLVGAKLKKFVAGCVEKPFGGFLAGAAVAGVTQSSAAVTMVAVGLAEAGAITFLQAAPVVMGANVGTTVTAQFIAIFGRGGDYKSAVGALAAAAGVIFGFFKNKTLKNVGDALVGFGLMLSGLSALSGRINALKSYDFLSGFAYVDNPFLLFLFGAAVAAVMARFTRASFVDVLSEDYMRTARAKGVSETWVVLKHGLRNAMIPVVTMMGLQFGFLLGGSIVVEKVFNWPGLGRLLVDSVEMRDYPVIQAEILLFSLEFILINLVVDVLYAAINPAIRYK